MLYGNAYVVITDKRSRVVRKRCSPGPGSPGGGGGDHPLAVADSSASGIMQIGEWGIVIDRWACRGEHRLWPCEGLARLSGGGAARARSLAALPTCCTLLMLAAHNSRCKAC